MERFDEEIEVIYERCRRTMRKMQRFVDRIRCGGRGGNGKMQHTRKGEYVIWMVIWMRCGGMRTKALNTF